MFEKLSLVPPSVEAFSLNWNSRSTTIPTVFATSTTNYYNWKISSWDSPRVYTTSSSRSVVMSATAKGKTGSTTTKTKKRVVASRKKKKDVPLIPHVDEDLIPSWMNRERTKVLTAPNCTRPKEDGNCVVYWMQRDVRTADNWALLYAQHLAQSQNVPLQVVYVLPPPPPPTTTSEKDDDSSLLMPPLVAESCFMTRRHGDFLLGGLKCVYKELSSKKYNIPMEILMPDHRHTVGDCMVSFLTQQQQQAVAVVCDFSPLRHVRDWIEIQTASQLTDIPMYQVDAHNIVPVWYASPKREVGARTLRPKLHKLLPTFLTHFPDLTSNDAAATKEEEERRKEPDWKACEDYLKLDESVPSSSSSSVVGDSNQLSPGTHAGMKRFESFLQGKLHGLRDFDTNRNDPNYNNVCSNMSPYINYGHVSFQRLALETRAFKRHPNGTAAFLEEGIVRRELSDNYVYYTPDHYDTLLGAAEWAQLSLQLHSTDPRDYVYTTHQLEKAQTHDDLWNAAQLQLTQEGTMHGFLRMYWAKKILEWTSSPEIALRTGLYFNDRYALDGNDPNGFVGVGWSVMGIHDMGWKERPIFGKIRFMNYAGCKRKFNISTFVGRYPKAAKHAAIANNGSNANAAAVTTTTTTTKSKPKSKPKSKNTTTTTTSRKKRKMPSSPYAMPKKISK